MRAAQVVAILNGAGDYDTAFTATFRAQISRARFDAIAAQLRSQYGQATGVERIDVTNRLQAVVIIGYERGTATVSLSLDAAAPHAIGGLLITGTAPRGDSLERVTAELRALPGSTEIGIYALGADAPRVMAQLNADVAVPIGSAFKLWVLAELVAQVKAGERRWADVVPLGAASLPSGITQSWPAGSPMTLQSLATLMLSISDNTATDTLMTVLGRERIDARAVALGAPRTSLPVLATREAFTLKSADAAAVAGWATLTPADRRVRIAALPAKPLDPAMFSGTPLRPEIEWFASPAAMVATLDWLRREGDPTTLAMLAVHQPSPATRRFAYAGYKGGSEPGVLSLNHLVRDKQGRWYAVVAAWHRSDALVEEPTLAGIVDRALTVIATPFVSSEVEKPN
ncbi:serine hydrolase [Sphingomonas qomolangmaensis]|uniref:Serine hydrolase n=1 Tax=Sphingomonas qomolangmaensis TaxID=2918765 RepID=A0ABY5LA66_9SPHN|nr:serine hydrolase [Sphingomonas qomolangmaensis]UUL82695.1 serine hydrolase [Sphingomonas qomolangmaensis]